MQAADGDVPFRPSFGRPGKVFQYRPKCLGETMPSPSSPVLPIMVPDTSIYMLFAHRQWRAGMLLADALYSDAFDIQDKFVLELGAGTGLPALTAALCGTPARVVVTDYDDEAIVAALQANKRRTQEANPERSMAPLSVMGHTWGQAMEDVLDVLPVSRTQPTPKYDVILLADCIWERFSHQVLLRSIVYLLARTPTARVHMVAGLHTGRPTLIQFLRRALDAGLMLVPVPRREQWPSAKEVGSPIETLPGAEHILELEVGGTLPEEDTLSTESLIVPTLTGQQRTFVLSRGSDGNDDESIQVRNHWLTVSSFAWASL